MERKNKKGEKLIRSSKKMSSEIQELSPQAPYRNIRRCLNDIPEEESLRHIIRTRFVNGMTEDFIAIILREILKGLYHLHVSLQYGYENTNARDIFVSTDQEAIAIGLAYVETRPFVQPGNPWERGRSETDGIWGLGIIALELAYGTLPRNCTGREQLVSMANNLVRILKLKLENDDNDDGEKEIEKAKKKGKEKLQTADNPKGKGKLLTADDQKGNGKLQAADDKKGKGKFQIAADQKGKGKLKIADDQKGKEKAKKIEKENKKLMIKLPELEKLLDDECVGSLVKKLLKEKKERGKKNAMTFLKKAYKKAKNIFRKNDDGTGREFSRDFLEVVMELLDKQNYTPALLILAHPFLRRRLPIDRARFERSIRGEA